MASEHYNCNINVIEHNDVGQVSSDTFDVNKNNNMDSAQSFNVPVRNQFDTLTDGEGDFQSPKRKKSLVMSSDDSIPLAVKQIDAVKEKMKSLEVSHSAQMDKLKAQLDLLNQKIFSSQASELSVDLNQIADPSSLPLGAKKRNTQQSSSKTNIDLNKKDKIPPIFCYNLNVKWLIRNFPSLNLQVKIINSNCCKVFTQSIEDFVLVKDSLASQEIDHYTFTPKSIKPINLLIKNLDSTFEPQEVENELKIKFPNINFLKVSRFITKRSKKASKDLNIWLIQVQSGTNITDLKKMNRFLFSIVSIEQLKGRGSIQCFRCQRFDHLSINCGMQPRCVKCAQTHKAGECAETNTSKLVCANCNGNHVASYRGCPKFKERINNRSQQIISRPVSGQTSKSFSSVPVNAGVSFAQMVNSQNATKQTSSNGLSFISNEIRNLFGCDISTILGKISSFIPEYKATASSDRKFKLLNFLFEVSSLNNDSN